MLTKSKPDRDAEIVRMRKDGKSMDEIATKFKLTHSRISQIFSAAVALETQEALNVKAGQR